MDGTGRHDVQLALRGTELASLAHNLSIVPLDSEPGKGSGLMLESGAQIRFIQHVKITSDK